MTASKLKVRFKRYKKASGKLPLAFLLILRSDKKPAALASFH